MNHKETPPINRAKELWHLFWKDPKDNFFSAKNDVITLVNIIIQESEYSGNNKAVDYWKRVLMEVEKL